ncbi:MAG TPA: FAD-dependent oxidoreductase [Vicinamibacteria bacterium]|nr:FAD-dependent oxidoreductase [Vicinamibacteria bacterium]
MEIPRNARVVTEADVVVVGGGPAGLAASVAAAREGASVVLVERYAQLGGLASGAMVLVLDDMCNGSEITVKGIAQEMIDRMAAMKLAVFPPEEDRRAHPSMYRKWARWGLYDYYARTKPAPVCYSTAFDPEGWKRASEDLVKDHGIHLRLHSWFSSPLMEGDRIRGIVSETNDDYQAIRADVVIDCSGDLVVAARAGAPYQSGSYFLTTVFRLGGVDFETADKFEYEQPDRFLEVDKRAKEILGGSWDKWWLKTPLPGIVWCNCPHMRGYDGAKVEDLTKAQLEGRRRIDELYAFVADNWPGFERSYLVDLAPQIGVRQTRLLEGEYVVTKEDVQDRVHFPDSVARGRDYYTPYRALVPKRVDQLLVAGRHYSATSVAQRTSREIPPCMAMGEAAGIAAAMALDRGILVRSIDVARLQKKLRERGADPGDVPSANATAREVRQQT